MTGRTESADAVAEACRGPLRIWTLNMPDRRNPISDDAVIERFVQLTDRANSDIDTRVVVLTGAGPVFSAGGNIKDMAQRTGMFGRSPSELRDGYRSGIQRLARAVYGCEVPIVAAVNGPAIGAGCDLAMMCDVRVAASNAYFAGSFVELGLVPGDGGAYFLPRVIGFARATQMLLTGERVDATTALDWGMVSEVVAPEGLLARAEAIAAMIAVHPPRAVRLTKHLLWESRRQDLDSLLELSASLQALAHTTEDHRAALAALRAEQRPHFTGR